MKPLLLSLLLLAGCQTRPMKLPAPVPEPLPIAKTPPPPAPPAEAETPLQRATQLVEALTSQNDALAARLRTAESRAAAPAPESSKPEAAVPSLAPIPALVASAAPGSTTAATTAPSDPATWLVPNADGIVDLTAVANESEAGPVNPFAVRVTPTSAVTETTLTVQGVVRAGKACALVNERLLEVGESVEQCRLTRIEPDAAIFAVGEKTMRLPFGEKPVRVRHT